MTDESIQPPRRIGRPRKEKAPLLEVQEAVYNNLHPSELLTLFSEGKLPPQVCKILHISKQTFETWLNQYPEFKKAYDLGMVACEAFWIEEGVRGLKKETKAFNFNQWNSFMTNVFKWTRSTGNSETTNISINTQVNQYNKYTDTQLRSFLLGKLENSGVVQIEDINKIEKKKELKEPDMFKTSDGIVDAEIEIGRDLSGEVKDRTS